LETKEKEGKKKEEKNRPKILKRIFGGEKWA
jgi:hypothetical protein